MRRRRWRPGLPPGDRARVGNTGARWPRPRTPAACAERALAPYAFASRVAHDPPRGAAPRTPRPSGGARSRQPRAQPLPKPRCHLTRSGWPPRSSQPCARPTTSRRPRQDQRPGRAWCWRWSSSSEHHGAPGVRRGTRARDDNQRKTSAWPDALENGAAGQGVRPRIRTPDLSGPLGRLPEHEHGFPSPITRHAPAGEPRRHRRRELRPLVSRARGGPDATCAGAARDTLEPTPWARGYLRLGAARSRLRNRTQVYAVRRWCAPVLVDTPVASGGKRGGALSESADEGWRGRSPRGGLMPRGGAHEWPRRPAPGAHTSCAIRRPVIEETAEGWAVPGHGQAGLAMARAWLTGAWRRARTARRDHPRDPIGQRWGWLRSCSAAR